MRFRFGWLVLVAVMAETSAGQSDFVNWESPHVNPIDLTPSGGRLLAVNTADGRLEVFDLSGGMPVSVGSVPVGLDPVSVRARNDDEAWVINHISDSVSVVDLTTMSVIATLQTGDEPTDVVFAGSAGRAFVSVSQINQVRVFDPANLAAPPVILNIEGEDPRALATDGSHVYAAIFESGNETTVLAQQVVSSPVNPYAGDVNPPPNDGASFTPAMKVGNPPPPPVSLIVRKDGGGAWRDDNGTDWSAAVPWDLHDHDVAIIDADTLGVSYVSGLMNLDMNLSVGPGGDVYVIGTDAINEVRYEPNLDGIFVRVMGAKVPAGGGAAMVADLNPHLDYTTSTVDQATRDLSIGDPRGIDWSPSRNRAYIAGMGSDNLLAVDASFNRVGLGQVGPGPTGVRVDEARSVAYVMNKFDASISVVDLDSLSELSRVGFHDATPPPVRQGRRHFYDTHETSGLGQAACASCHVDGRMDQVAWDLGDPAGDVKPFNQTCQAPNQCEEWHPMKGPMATQTLFGILGGPMHWRADRENLAAFNGAFMSLMGDDEQLTGPELAEFTGFVASLTPPPNPFRNLDNTLKAGPIAGGNPQTGFVLYTTANLDAVQCSTCHTLPTGTNGTVTPRVALMATQSMKVPQLRNLYEKTGFSQASSSNNRGFGFTHDGSTDTLFDFLQFPGFSFAAGAAGDQQRRDVAAFLLSFSTDTHAGVGAQATAGGTSDDRARRNVLRDIADGGQVGFVGKGVVNGEPRGFVYRGGDSFEADIAGEFWTLAQLDAAADNGDVITYTLVPLGSETRIGVDRDRDGYFDRDEYLSCSNPADPASVPGGDLCPPDIAGGDFEVTVSDLLVLLAQWGQSRTDGDINCDGAVDVSDLLELLAAWGPCV